MQELKQPSEAASSGEPLSPQRFDVDGHRRFPHYPREEMLRRVLWGVCQPLFRFSPRKFQAWRRFLLRCFGADVGSGAHFHPSATIYYPWMLTAGEDCSIGERVLIYNLGPIHIGARTMISLNSHLCAGSHDDTHPQMPLDRPPIWVGDDVWVCADVFISPNTRIGDGATLLPRAVVLKDVAPWVRVGGHPAREISQRKFVVAK